MQSSNSRRRPNQTTGQKPQVPSAKKFVFQASPNVNSAQMIKLELIEKLNSLIQNIGNTKNVGTCTEDPIIVGLQSIEQQAKIFDFKQVVKMTNLAIGKRILNLQLERKRNQLQNKIEKKRQIQQYFRQNRINKTNYEQIALQKLKQNILIVKPYPDGKAFIQSTLFYEKVIGSLTGQSYQECFDQSDYLNTVKYVNKIYFKNFSNTCSSESKKQASKHPVLRLGFVLFMVIAVLCISLGFMNKDNQQTSLSIGLIIKLIFGINIVMLLLMTGLAISSYVNGKVGRNQLEQTMLQINQYFNAVNERSRQLGYKHQWRCPDHFLYLEVKFDAIQ